MLSGMGNFSSSTSTAGVNIALCVNLLVEHELFVGNSDFKDHERYSLNITIVNLNPLYKYMTGIQPDDKAAIVDFFH